MGILEDIDFEKLQQHRWLLQEFNKRKLDRINILFDTFVNGNKMTQNELDILVEFKEFLIRQL